MQSQISKEMQTMFDIVAFPLPEMNEAGLTIIRPYIMVRAADDRIIPRWLEYLGPKPDDSQLLDTWEHHLLASMAFGKPLNKYQTLGGWNNLPWSEAFNGQMRAKRANMIGLYELIKSGTIPKVDEGRVTLYCCDNFYTVDSQSERAAYEVVLKIFLRFDMAASYRSAGLDPIPIVEELKRGAKL